MLDPHSILIVSSTNLSWVINSSGIFFLNPFLLATMSATRSLTTLLSMPLPLGILMNPRRDPSRVPGSLNGCGESSPLNLSTSRREHLSASKTLLLLSIPSTHAYLPFGESLEDWPGQSQVARSTTLS